MRLRPTLVHLTLALAVATAHAQQIADSSFSPPIARPAHTFDQGPVIMIDEAHHNFHTADGRFYAFAELLRRDGYRILPSSCALTLDSLNRGRILVISNALNERNTEDWSLPTPSALTDAEITAVAQWVRAGGSLFLIADHMPFPGAVENLAAEFGFRLNNGFALDTSSSSGGTYVFRRAGNTLLDHAITRGRTDGEQVDSVVSFTGEAFQADSAEALMVFGSGVVSLMPEIAWEFSDSTESVNVSGWCQGAVSSAGEGRVAVFGEAAMFSAQLAGPDRIPVGLNSPEAPQNWQFLLNVMHWLDGSL